MSFYQFGPWRPDLPDRAELDDSGTLRLIEATNVVPDSDSYQPQPEAAVVTDALSSTCQGTFCTRDDSGNVNWFAGTATGISRISSTTPIWEEVGSGYALTEEDKWSFEKYGNQVYAATPTNDLQFITLSSGSTFSNVAGNPPRFRHIAIIRNFLVGAGTAEEPQRVQWSGIDNPQSWTLAAVTQADFQDLLGPGGWNQGIVVGLAGSDAVVFQERAVWRMMYVGTPFIFQFDTVENARGAVSSGSIVQSAGFAFYISSDGFYVFDGATSSPIGHGKIDEFFFRDADSSEFKKISSASDPNRSLVMWSYQSVNSGIPDKIIVYNWNVQEWSIINSECDIIFRGIRRHGSPIGDSIFSGFDKLHKGVVFDGSNKSAVVSTAEYQLNKSGRCLVTQVYPIVETGLPNVEIIHRSNQSMSLSSEASSPVNQFGFCQTRTDDRLMRFRSSMNSGTTWSKWKGFKLNFTPTGSV
ncbi:hypothetical protein UFOVP1244_37 [uncultured Caudovirales phage]|uniref:Uncharacterized protein n=1 Tax=uncultured Caudovirales phage TaxID=2100421 RepID=A0A6J5RDK5_9CAUD|nr:hypothetical protein UFOVP1244_37 [uncultured Caudovirales phage]